MEKPRIAYLDAKHARETAQSALKEYTERIYPRDLLAAEAEIKQAEEWPNQVKKSTDETRAWAERIRSK